MDKLTQLAHAARLGDQRAAREFVDTSYAHVWRLCASLVDEQAADDLAQETFLRTYRALDRFRGDAPARVWVLAIARSVCMDELRARTRQRRRAQRLGADAHEPTHAPDAADELVARELLDALDPDRRAAFILTQLFRLSYAEAAVVCGCPPGTIRSRVARAREDLIRLMHGAQPIARRTEHP